ncbi:MAG: peroxiredoxin [Chitinophagaceae bacterium]|nr:MAG: peroxiredoxin [Chitinophagaceae bacterium]
MSLQIGDSAPDFTLYNSDKTPVTLSEQRGKNVVLLFFPLAFTSVCTAELCGVRDNIASYNALNATIFGISVDSVYSLGEFKKQQNLNFDLLSDFNKEASSTYGALYEQFGYGMKGVSQRAAFVVDSKGVIRYAEVLENAGLTPDFDKISETLKNLS